MRHLLRNQIIESWTAAIETDYQRQRINSERSLQASLWSQLNRRLHHRTRRMFIEPAIKVMTSLGPKTLYPDLVVCNSNKVIAVIELKYEPRKSPTYRKDIETLRLIASQREAVAISNNRYRGKETDSTEYGLARETMFVWAGIHRQQIPAPGEDAALLFNAGIPELKNCFLELHAVTRVGQDPSIHCHRG